MGPSDRPLHQPTDEEHESEYKREEARIRRVRNVRRRHSDVNEDQAKPNQYEKDDDAHE
jgi:hypothetical protein